MKELEKYIPPQLSDTLLAPKCCLMTSTSVNTAFPSISEDGDAGFLPY